MALNTHQHVPLLPQSSTLDAHRIHPFRSFESMKAAWVLLLTSQLRALLDPRLTILRGDTGCPVEAGFTFLPLRIRSQADFHHCCFQ